MAVVIQKRMKIIVIGGGVAGLSAAIHLHRAGQEVLLLEASDRVGGRIKTDHYQGFLLDHGFQVLQTAYPEVQKMLDLPALKLRTFDPGAVLLAENGAQYVVADPRRKPSLLLQTLLAPIGSLKDKFALLRMAKAVTAGRVEQIFDLPETTTEADLATFGVGPRLKSQFLEPFFNGIFLSDLSTSNRMFRFVLRMFAEGYAALPAEGMEAIPRQLAAKLPAEAIRCNAPVQAIEGKRVFLANGEVLEAEQIILATNPDSPLVQQFVSASPRRDRLHGTVCMYFAADQSPARHRLLMLHNRKGRLVNHLAVLSDIAPEYAPAGKSLISVNLANGIAAHTPAEVLAELSAYFSTSGWQHLRTVVVPAALPDQQQVAASYSPCLSEHLVYAGDYALYGSLNATLAAGRLAAEAVL